jgi:hypothetical protein
MNPFDLPPSTPLVSTGPPAGRRGGAGRGRGRTVLVSLAAAGLVAAGVAGVSQLASADRAETTGAASTPDGGDANAPIEPVGAAPDDSNEEPVDEPPIPADDEGDAPGDAPTVDGEIVIDVGDGEPIVIDLGDVIAGGESFDEFAECVGFDGGIFAPPFDREAFPDGRFDLDELDGELDGDLEGLLDELLADLLDDDGRFELPPFGGVVTGDGTHITIVGPDGVSIVDLGDGDGSVTISQEDGELSIATEGDATVAELGALFGDLPIGEVDPGVPLNDLLDGMPPLEQVIDELDLPDPETIEGCLGLLGEG